MLAAEATRYRHRYDAAAFAAAAEELVTLIRSLLITRWWLSVGRLPAHPHLGVILKCLPHEKSAREEIITE